MSVTLFVEGGGSGKALKTELRRGFSSLLMKSGFEGRMPRVVACGSRNDTFDRFKIQFEETGSTYPMMLVDSESSVAQGNRADRPSGHGGTCGPKTDGSGLVARATIRRS